MQWCTHLRPPGDRPKNTVLPLLWSYLSLLTIIIPSRFFLVTSRFTWYYLYRGLKPDALKMGTPLAEKNEIYGTGLSVKIAVHCPATLEPFDAMHVSENGPGTYIPYHQNHASQKSVKLRAQRGVYWNSKGVNAARGEQLEQHAPGPKKRECCLLTTARPVHKLLDPYHWQGFDCFFPDVAQYSVGALQVLVEAFLVGKEVVRLVRGCRRHGWVSHCSPQQRISCH